MIQAFNEREMEVNPVDKITQNPINYPFQTWELFHQKLEEVSNTKSTSNSLLQLPTLLISLYCDS